MAFSIALARPSPSVRSKKTMMPSARDVAIAYAWSFAGWSMVALLTGSQAFVINSNISHKYNFLQSLIVPAVRASTAALLTPPLYFMVMNWPFARGRLGISLLRYTGLACSFIVAFSAIRWLLYPPYDYINMKFTPRSFESLIGLPVGGFADLVSQFLLIVAGAHAWVFYRDSQRQNLKQSELQRELAELQLQFLQMQLHPHFIFNTLHGITTLMSRDVETAKSMLLHLADLLRAAISMQAQDLVPLKEELNFISSYVSLEKMRLGERLQVSFDVEDEANGVLVPHMILQPIVENAILHGAAACREGGWVNVECKTEGKSISLRVLNSVGSQTTAKSSGLGLKNTRAKLQNLFDDEATLYFAVQDGIATTQLIFPVIRAAQEATP